MKNQFIDYQSDGVQYYKINGNAINSGDNIESLAYTTRCGLVCDIGAKKKEFEDVIQ
jgi:hypothetical protein